MKKIYLSFILTGLTFSGVIAQESSAPHRLKTVNHISNNTPKPVVTGVEKAVIWTEDFAGGLVSPTNGTWTLGGANGDVWKKSFTPSNGEWSANTDPMLSTTAANGYMLFDADSINEPFSPNYINLTGELISPTIDLSGETSALLEFQQDFRYCCQPTQTLIVSVSNDDGATWGTPQNVTFNVDGNDSYFDINGSYDVALNISSEAAGQAAVKIKFTFDGNDSGSSHYYWTIDDITISDLPDHNLVTSSYWAAGATNDGVEYGRTPEDQADANWLIGTTVYNFGANVETNVTLDANFGAFTSQTVETSFDIDTTIFMETAEPLALTPALYTGVYTVTSDDEIAGSPLFFDNVGAREFEITPSSTVGSIYGQDGIGVYANPVLSTIGTDNFTGGEDGLVCATMYHIKNTADVSGIRLMLATGTVAGGEIFGSIKDTVTFWADDMSSLFSTLGETVTSADIAAGYIDLVFPSAISLTPGAYYAAVELFSNAGASDILIVDDLTVAQPGDASAIYIAGDQSYSNGEALGIRLLMGSIWLEVSEVELTGVTIYPNPSSGIVNISNDNATKNVIEVHNAVGQIVLTKEVSSATTIDLSANGTGIYLVKVSNNSGSTIERVVIK